MNFRLTRTRLDLGAMTFEISSVLNRVEMQPVRWRSHSSAPGSVIESCDLQLLRVDRAARFIQRPTANNKCRRTVGHRRIASNRTSIKIGHASKGGWITYYPYEGRSSPDAGRPITNEADYIYEKEYQRINRSNVCTRES